MAKRSASRNEVTSRMAEIMRRERVIKGWSQLEVSKKLRITQGRLSKLERGALVPTALVWLEFCSIFGINPIIAMDEKKFSKRMDKLDEKLDEKLEKGEHVSKIYLQEANGGQVEIFENTEKTKSEKHCNSMNLITCDETGLLDSNNVTMIESDNSSADNTKL